MNVFLLNLEFLILGKINFVCNMPYFSVLYFRAGSIIVVYNIVFDESSQTFQNILPAIGQLMDGTRMIYRNQSVSVTTEGNDYTLAIVTVYNEYEN